MVARLGLGSLVAGLVWFSGCSSEDCTDRSDRTGPDCGGDGDADTDTDTDTDSDTDTDTDDQPVGPFLTAQVTPSVGNAYTFTSNLFVGGVNTTDWGFAALGTAGQLNSLSFALAGAGGIGLYTLEAPNGDNFSAYTDIATFGVYGGFTSVTGELDVTRWDETTGVYGSTWLVDGTFDVSLTNFTPNNPNPVTLEVTGEFTEVTLSVAVGE